MKKYRKIGISSNRGYTRKEGIDRQTGNSFFSISFFIVLVVIISLVTFFSYSIDDFSVNVYYPPELSINGGNANVNNKKDKTNVLDKEASSISYTSKAKANDKTSTTSSESSTSIQSKIVTNIVTGKQIISEISSSKNDYNNYDPSVTDVPNPKQNSKFAYVTLISGIDKKFKYRGFLYNALIMKESLAQHKSTADFIALIGYNDINDIEPFRSDMNLLKSHGIIIHVLHRLLDHDVHDLSFAEMALLKVTPWSFIQYDRVQFFDGDVMPTKNMDCFFSLEKNTFTVGLVSPLNSGWYLAIPNIDDYNYLRSKAVWRLGRDWDEDNGWVEKMPVGLYYRGGVKLCEKWLFNGADMDQGLLAHHFVINKGGAMLIDTDTSKVRIFEKGFLHEKDKSSTSKKELSSCNGLIPTNHFAHFTGRSKPWMLDLTNVPNKNRNSDLFLWRTYLDSLKLEVNSSNIGSLRLGSPLGFFNGGYKNNKSTKKKKRVNIT